MKKLIGVVLAAWCLGCLHTREVERGEEKKQPAKAAAAKQKPRKPATPTARPSDTRPPVEEGRPELSVSPEGLMRPEGPRLIQQALVKRGYLSAEHQAGKWDAETSAALRKFQADQQLAKTGSPDRETVRRLGLAVERVFMSARIPNA